MQSDSERSSGGFLGVIVRDILHEWVQRTLFGRRYVKFGQCLAGMWPYVFEIGGILGAKHAATLDAFMSAFLGMPDRAGEAKGVAAGIAAKLLERHSLDSMTVRDCVQADLMERSDYTRDERTVVAHLPKKVRTALGEERAKAARELSFLAKYGQRKISPEKAAENAWTYASIGAALGAVYPNVFRAMYERTHVTIPREEWQRMYAEGLDIGPEQPRQRTYRQAEGEENKAFMEFCRVARPDLYSILKRD